MRLGENYDVPAGVHAFQKVDGVLALDQHDVIQEEELSEGDRISWYSLPDGKFLVCKNPEGTPIRRISSAYIYLEADITVEEK